MRIRIRNAALVSALVAMIAFLAPAAQAAPPATAGRFIITIGAGHDPRGVAAEYRAQGAAINFVYTAALNGFAGSMSETNLGRLRADRRVERIERDGVVAAIATTQTRATWGLDRVDQEVLPLSGSYTYDQTGSGVTAYIVDTGIRYSHSEFGGRAQLGRDVFGGNGSDCNGHGTHVAGTVGGTTYGVAKAASLVAVRVLDCNGSGTWSGVIEGLDWIVSHHGSAPAVANMSLGGGANSSVDDAVRRVHGDGVAVVVAAGNGNAGGKAQDACGYSPARVPEAVTTGATTSTDAKTSWSNYGSCVDFFAPGSAITSAWSNSDTATSTISGTSMAAPHVAGAAALYLQANPTSSASGVRDALYAATTKGVVSSSKTDNNHLLYTRLAPAAPVPTGTVTGVVTAADGGAAISGASVTVGGLGTTTNTSGAYSITVPTGTYEATVSATGYVTDTKTIVVDQAGLTHNVTLATVTTEPAPDSAIALSVTIGEKAKGVTDVTSSWTDDGGSGSYDVYVNGSHHKTVAVLTETTYWRGGGSLTYRVCRTATTICSNDVTVVI